MWKALIVFTTLIALGEGHLCRDYFKLVQSKAGVYGLITFYPPKTSEHVLKVVLSIPATQLATKNAGVLSLFKDTQSSAEDLRVGSPLLYKIQFPAVSPLPKISEISHNGRVFCYGDNLYGQYVTMITLINKFKPNPNLVKHSAPQFTERNQNFYDSKTIQCGTRAQTTQKVSSFIVGGYTAEKYDFPWLVAQYHRNAFVCGGSLLSSRIVSSAAHCIREKRSSQTKNPLESTFYMGKYNLQSFDDVGLVSSGVERFVVHPNWNPYSEKYDSDIGIVVLAKKIQFSKTIRPVCLWRSERNHADLVGSKGVIAGWGLTERGTISNLPMYISLPVVDDGDCIRSNYALARITSKSTFCVGDNSRSVPCQGDSGGGFIMRFGNQYYLRGIVTAGLTNEDGECSIKDYVIFTDVALFSDWVNYYMERYP